MPRMKRPTSFALHIHPLFRALDIDHMKGRGSRFDLSSYDDVKRKASDIYDRLSDEADPMLRKPTADPGPTSGFFSSSAGWTKG